MIRKHGLFLSAALLLFLCALPFPAANAETECTAAAAARLLREGRDSDQYAVWETTVVHLYENDAVRDYFLVRSMLACLTGQGYAPDTEPGLRFMPCYEVPFPTDGMTLYKGAQYNFHGLVLSDSPLTEISLTVEPRGESSRKSAQSAVVRIPAEESVLRFSLDDDTAGGKKTINEMIDMRALPTGRHRLTLSAANAAGAKKTLYQADFTVAESKNSYPLMQCNFGDNYSLAARFFNYETELFTPRYSLKTEGGRVVSLSTEWRETYLVDTKTVLGRCHEKAYPYFMKAWEYLNNTHIRLHDKYRATKIIPLVSLIGSTCDSYVPRFQSNERYISHHSLGTCLDVNYDYYPNNNVETNHQVIGDDVRNHLTYNGIMEDEATGLKYYDFTYTGSYPAKVDHIPKSIINYLLYELAFYRAGFSWGFYYISSCDGMHFTLTDCDYSRHDNPIMGLRKVYEYYN